MVPFIPDPPPGTSVNDEFTQQFMYPAPNTVYETMTKVNVRFYTVRVWRETSEFEEGPDPEVVEVVKKAGEQGTAKAIANAVCQLPRISAVEILDFRTGNGGLKYPD